MTAIQPESGNLLMHSQSNVPLVLVQATSASLFIPNNEICMHKDVSCK